MATDSTSSQPDDIREPAGRQPNWSRLIISLAAVGGIFATLVYAFLRLSYVEFYSQLGITPEDVGLGPSTIVGDHALYFFWADTRLSAEFLAVFAAAAVVYSVVVGAGMARTEWPRGTRMNQARQFALRVVKAFLTFLVPGVYLVVTVALFWSLAASSKQLGLCVRAGYSEVGQTAFIPGLPDVTVAEERAWPARVAWLDSGAKLRPRFTGPLLYLGRSDGQLVLWNVRTKSAMRVPEEQVVVSTRVYGHRFLGTTPMRGC